MIARARLMATRPGFVSVNLEKFAAAHHSPELRRKWPQFGRLADAIEPGICELAYSNAA